MSPEDELEHELEAFQPRPASPELRRRIGRRLIRRQLLIVTAMTAVAASVTVGLLLNRPRPPQPIIIGPPPVAVAPAPSLLAYKKAAARSPEALDDLLDRQAVRSGWSDPAGRANSESLTLRGLRQ
jgi:hypothetical protein